MSIPSINDRSDAVAFLDDRSGRGIKPGLDRIGGLLDYMANPHLAFPIIHVAGTNGKTTVTRLASDILGAHGLRVGTFISPHLHRVEDRFLLSGLPFDEQAFTDAVRDIAWFVEEYETRSGHGVTYFELTAALAFSAFADAAVDVAVIEVGLGGRLDATNVVDAAVSVLTGVAMDHMSYLGDSITQIAGEKAAILKDGGRLVTGPLPPTADGPITAAVADTGSRWFRFGDDFRVSTAIQAVGGWSVDLEGIYASYSDLYLPLHGRHQVDNLATAAAAVEVFLEGPLDEDALRTATTTATSPGRLEVADRHPLILLDGAHNEEGFHGLATTLTDEFPPQRWNLVVGMRGERVPQDLLRPLQGLVGAVWATEPDDEAAIAAADVAAAAAEVLDVPVETMPAVSDAVDAAIAAAGAEGAVVVAGSLYVVGEARSDLVGEAVRPAAVHVRYEAPIGDADLAIEDADLAIEDADLMDLDEDERWDGE